MKLAKKIGIFIVAFVILIAFAALLFLKFWPSFGKSPSKSRQEQYAERTDAFYDGTFHTPEEFELIVDVENQKEDADIELEPKGNIPVNKITKLPQAGVEDLTVTWFGHSTSLLQIHGMTVFIDPVLSEYSSPVGFVGAKRMAEVPMEAENLPEIDLLLISHDHYDHLDYQTIKDIDAKVKEYCVPLGVENHLERWGVDPDKIHTLAWWEEADINGLKVASTPGQHYSGRLPWKNNSTLWSGYVLQDEYHSVYYTGDTGYGEFFEEIKERYGEPELMLSEDGQYDPEWPDCHMNPEEVLKASEDMKAKWLIPVHWAGFVLSRHAWDDPVEQLTALAEHSDVSVATPRIGETVSFSEIGNYQQKWWREVGTNKDTSEKTDKTQEEQIMNMQIGQETFQAVLYDNDSTRALREKLPMTIQMDEMNGNEKYYFMEETIPSAAEAVGNIKAGDFMLFGSDCLVLFYEDFQTSYTYTRLGYVKDIKKFVSALGSGSVAVTFSVEQ